MWDHHWTPTLAQCWRCHRRQRPVFVLCCCTDWVWTRPWLPTSYWTQPRWCLCTELWALATSRWTQREHPPASIWPWSPWLRLTGPRPKDPKWNPSGCKWWQKLRRVHFGSKLVWLRPNSLERRVRFECWERKDLLRWETIKSFELQRRLVIGYSYYFPFP